MWVHADRARSGSGWQQNIRCSRRSAVGVQPAASSGLHRRVVLCLFQPWTHHGTLAASCQPESVEEPGVAPPGARGRSGHGGKPIRPGSRMGGLGPQLLARNCAARPHPAHYRGILSESSAPGSCPGPGLERVTNRRYASPRPGWLGGPEPVFFRYRRSLRAGVGPVPYRLTASRSATSLPVPLARRLGISLDARFGLRARRAPGARAHAPPVVAQWPATPTGLTRVGIRDRMAPMSIHKIIIAQESPELDVGALLDAQWRDALARDDERDKRAIDRGQKILIWNFAVSANAK